MRMTGSGVPSMKAPGRVCRRAPGERFSSAHQPAVQGRPARGVWRAGCMMRSHASRSRGSHAPAAPCCRFRLAEIGACRAIHCVPPPIRSRPSVSCRGADWAGAPAMCRAAASRCRIGRVTMVAHAGPRPRRQPPCRYASLRLAAGIRCRECRMAALRQKRAADARGALWPHRPAFSIRNERLSLGNRAAASPHERNLFRIDGRNFHGGRTMPAKPLRQARALVMIAQVAITLAAVVYGP